MSTGLFYGQIVRIRVAHHGKEKVRPVVVVTPKEAMAEGPPLVGVAITGTPELPTGRFRCCRSRRENRRGLDAIVPGGCGSQADQPDAVTRPIAGLLAVERQPG